MNFLKQTFEPWRSEAKNIFTSPFASLPFLRQNTKAPSASELGQILVDFPLRDRVVVGPPLRLLQIDVRPVELVAHHPAAEIVRLESRHGFQYRPRRLPDAALLELLIGELIHIDELRIARIEILLDAVEPGAKEHGGGQIRIGRRIDGAAFPSRA